MTRPGTGEIMMMDTMELRSPRGKGAAFVAIDKVKKYFKRWGLEENIREFKVSSATVELAAQALGCEPERIAKTLAFRVKNRPVLIVTSGDARIDNTKYRAHFQAKAKMLRPDEVESAVGHAIGGVCPFGANEGVPVYLDVSLRRFCTVFPACGSSNSAIELTIRELEKYSKATGWVDVCRGWNMREQNRNHCNPPLTSNQNERGTDQPGFPLSQ